MDSDIQPKIDEAIAAERSRWEQVLQNAHKVSEEYGVQVEDLTAQVQSLRQKLQEQEASHRTSAAERIKDLEEALTRARLECLEREKNVMKQARLESEQALQKERQVKNPSNVMVDCPASIAIHA